MVDDKEIKATISPFICCRGEIKKFDGKDGYVSMNQIIHKINLGHITEIHFKIIEIINKFEFITSRQLFQLLTVKEIPDEIKSQDKLNDRLEQLVKTKILTRYYFTSEKGDCIYRVYCLEKMGKYLLDSRGIECKWQPTDNTKPVSMIKKRLVGNQIILAYLRKVKNFSSYIIKPSITAKKSGKTFKVMGCGITLEKEGKKAHFIFETIRREEEWETKFVERLSFYKDFYESFMIMDSGYDKMPQLIIVCEDDKHMAECFRILVTKEIQIEQIKYYFTTDLKQNEEKLDKSLTEFKLDEVTKKYKMEIIEAKILG